MCDKYLAQIFTNMKGIFTILVTLLLMGMQKNIFYQASLLQALKG